MRASASSRIIATIGTDIGKNTFHLVGLDERGAQAARVMLLRPANWPKHSFGRWLEAAAKRMHHNVVAAALANKLTRIAWSVLYHGRCYEPRISAELA